jgi:hypothetical protein
LRNNLRLDKDPLPTQLGGLFLLTNLYRIKEMTKEELNGMFSMLEDTPEEDIRKFSVPTSDIGLYKYYMPKQSIIEIIAKKLGS